MRLPNGYGSIIKLGGKRRKPYAVRIYLQSNIKNDKGSTKNKYKYLGYFKERKDALQFLSNYNAGVEIEKQKPNNKQPTFLDVYNKWFEYRNNMNKKMSVSTIRSYNYTLKKFESIYYKRFYSIRLEDLQDIIDEYKGFSKGTASNLQKLLSSMYEYSMKHDIVDKDYSKLIDYEYSPEKKIKHKKFSDDEISYLWKATDTQFVDWILIMIYMGWRASEFCELKTGDIHLTERYIVGGMKTAAGTRRIVPIHDGIIHLIKRYYNVENEYFLCSKTGVRVYYQMFLRYWNEAMKAVKMDHTPHDTRYTTASLLDRFGANKVCIKKILGHSTKDVTDGTYIQKDISELLEAIDLIRIH